MLARREESESYYNFTPSLGAAIVFVVLYSLAFIGTVVQWLRFRPLVWMVMVIAAAMEAVGYICCIISTQNTSAETVFILQFALIILAPVLMAAALYIVFGRIIFLVVPKEQRTFRICWVPPRWITPIFVGFDIIALFLQLTGAVMISSANGNTQDDIDNFDRGQNLALVGVIVQIAAFGVFTIAAIRFNFTSKAFVNAVSELMDLNARGEIRATGAALDRGHGQDIVKPWRSDWQHLLRCVNLSTILILIRSIFRVLEFTEGRNGYINTHEWPFYIFDSLPISPVSPSLYGGIRASIFHIWG
ncbi:RTA1 like protein-domain-containing protein [Aspergillus unguis]